MTIGIRLVRERSLTVVRPKFRVRTLVILVAVIALGLWGEQMRRRRAYCLEMADKHVKKIRAEFYTGGLKSLDERPMRHAHAKWHRTLRDAYLRSAGRPWEAVPPEPPEPSVFPAPRDQGR
jgi:hypothetical protein